MKKIGRRKLRKIRLSDFRKQLPCLDSGIVLVEGDGFIDMNKIREVFPDEADRAEYIKSLYEGLGQGLD